MGVYFLVFVPSGCGLSLPAVLYCVPPADELTRVKIVTPTFVFVGAPTNFFANVTTKYGTTVGVAKYITHVVMAIYILSSLYKDVIQCSLRLDHQRSNSDKGI